jgi:uncharacterized protein YdeI (YjbR/CyaY-like superfamily)
LLLFLNKFGEGEMMSITKMSHLKRSRHAMPAFVEAALLERDLMTAYRSRPAYQQNDYIGWIKKARRKETQEKRLAQMLDELERGTKYMKMAYQPKM